MTVQITIRNVPEPVRNELAARAASRRQSMQEYLLQELERLASRPTLDRWLEEVSRQKARWARSLPPDVVLGHRDADRR
jgi:hypothetical protein